VNIPRKNFRSVFKWGDPNHEEILDSGIRRVLKEVFGLSDDCFSQPFLAGERQISLNKASALAAPAIAELREIVGPENVETDDFSRAYHAYGKTYFDVIRLRLGMVDTPPDVIVYPRSDQDIHQIMSWCSNNGVPLVPFGGHSSVTRGLECPHGGVSLDLTRHLNQVISVNETNSTVRVQAGIGGPRLEQYLNAFESGYTLGHFPQSFEHSTVGGWVVTRGAGQESTCYGKIEDMVRAIRLISPVGTITTKDYPAMSIGPDLNNMIMGSEGTFGVVTEVTLRIRAYRPQNVRYFSFIFPTFEQAIQTMRLAMQAEIGHPAMFRLSDPEETDFSFRIKGYDRKIDDRLLRLMGYHPRKRCLMYVTAKGDPDFSNLVERKISKLARQNGAFALGSKPVLTWLEQRFSSAYLRDPLMDAGIMVDTLETAVTWDNLINVWDHVRQTIKKRSPAVAMVHLSHIYETGANLYFTFLATMDRDNPIDDFLQFQASIIQSIQQHGGALSHHHGIGRMMAPWLEQELGPDALAALRALKKHFDPHNIMNPGGTLHLD